MPNTSSTPNLLSTSHPLIAGEWANPVCPLPYLLSPKHNSNPFINQSIAVEAEVLKFFRVFDSFYAVFNEYACYPSFWGRCIFGFLYS